MIELKRTMLDAPISVKTEDEPKGTPFWRAYGLFPHITLRLMRSFVIPAMILTLFAALSAATVTHISLRNEATQSMISRMNAYLDSTVYIANTLDADLLELTTANFLKAPNVTSVELTIPGFPKFFRANTPPNDVGWFSSYEVVVDIPPSHDAPPDAKPIGQLLVKANYARVNKVTMMLALSSAFFVIIVSSALVLLMLLFVRRNAIAPLLQFASFLGGSNALQLVVPQEGETETDAFFRFCREQVVSMLAKEARLSALVANVQGIALRNRIRGVNQDLIWINDGVETILGYPTSRLIGPKADLHFRDLFHPDDLVMQRPIVRTAVSEMRPYEFKVRVLTAKGTYKWLLARGRPFVDVDGEIVSETLLVDIDDHQRREMALEESERRLSAMVANVAGIAVRSREIEGEQRAVWINDGIEAILGIPAHKLMGPRATMRLRDLFHPDDLAQHQNMVADHIRAHMPYEFKIRLRTILGEYKWMLARGRPTIETSGELITETLLVDIDEQVRKENWLAAVVTALDYSQDSIVIEGPDRKVIYANQAAHDGVRDVAGPLVGRYLHDVFTNTEPNAKYLYRQIRRAILKHGRWRENVVYHSDNGVSTVHDMRVAVIPGGGMLYASTDITEATARDAREAELQGQLAETQKMESLGRLAGGVAHDFNNILAATRAFADLIAGETEEGSRPNIYASRIVTACGRAADLVSQILTFSRAQDAIREPVNVANVMSEAEIILRGRLPTNTMLQVPSVSPDLFIMANEGQVAQIILNLGINASDALNGQSGKVTITTGLTRIKGNKPPFTKGLSTAEKIDGFFYATAALRPGTDYLCITCKDNGSGITASIAQKIFDPFFTTKQKRSGSGLGLAVVNSIVAANDGVITVRSRSGVGATFEVYWPIYTEPVEVSEETQHSESKEEYALNGSERILIVDDEEDVADALSIALMRIGYRTTVCYSPLQALEFVKDLPIGWDVVISDQIMPHLRGLDLIQRIKQLNPSLKAILCTGYSDKSGEEGALQRGADLFFMKPSPATVLAAGIRQLMDKAAA